MGSNVNEIGEINFLDVIVKIYHDPYYDNSDEDRYICSWKMRNTIASYAGLMYMSNETGKIIYSEGVVIPEQTEKDKEILPKFIITGKKTLNTKNSKQIIRYLIKEYIRRNIINGHHMDIKEIKALSLEEKKKLLTELAVRNDYTRMSFLPAIDKMDEEVTDELIMEDMIGLFQAIERGDTMDEFYTTKIK